MKSYSEIEEEYDSKMDKDFEEWNFFKADKYFILAINEEKDLFGFIKRNFENLSKFRFEKYYKGRINLPFIYLFL